MCVTPPNTPGDPGRVRATPWDLPKLSPTPSSGTTALADTPSLGACPIRASSLFVLEELSFDVSPDDSLARTLTGLAPPPPTTRPPSLAPPNKPSPPWYGHGLPSPSCSAVDPPLRLDPTLVSPGERKQNPHLPRAPPVRSHPSLC
ncbi:hypothetical protein SLA2020_270210 [Shorea laevis]